LKLPEILLKLNHYVAPGQVYTAKLKYSKSRLFQQSIWHLMKTVEIFRLDMFGLDAYLFQSEENKKSLHFTGKLYPKPRIFERMN